MFSSSDSFEVLRINCAKVAKFFLCKVCRKFPREAKMCSNYHHIYWRTCIDNFKENIDSTKCSPAIVETERALLMSVKFPPHIEILYLLKDLSRISMKVCRSNAKMSIVWKFILPLTLMSMKLPAENVDYINQEDFLAKVSRVSVLSTPDWWRSWQYCRVS